MLPVTYGYARVSKADDSSKNLDTQILELQRHGIREDLVFTDVASGRALKRQGWQDLMSRIQPGDTLVVAFLDRLSRSFEDGVRIQMELTNETSPSSPCGRTSIPGRAARRPSSSGGPCWPRGLPGGLGQRADQAGAGPGPGGGEARGQASGVVS